MYGGRSLQPRAREAAFGRSSDVDLVRAGGGLRDLSRRGPFDSTRSACDGRGSEILPAVRIREADLPDEAPNRHATGGPRQPLTVRPTKALARRRLGVLREAFYP